MSDEKALIEQAKSMDQASLYNLLEQLSDHYHNDVSVIQDRTFDQLVDLYEERFGDYDQVGSEPRGEKVALPYYLGSLRTKIKKEPELKLWVQKFSGPYVLEDKVDGLAILYTSNLVNGKRIYHLYTRGNGKEGSDVSHMLKYLTLPQLDMDIAVRGEIVMLKETFKKQCQGFKNPRNMVPGIVVTSKDSFNPSLAKELQFIAFRIMDSAETPEQQLLQLNDLGFTIPWAATTPTISMSELQQVLTFRNTEAPYEIDGLVIYHNAHVEYPIGEAPRHVMAFKMDTTAETTVTDVIWEASKDRLLKPVIHYEPVEITGATCQKAAGDNARYIVNNNIGPGAKIVVTRSGNTIPRVVAVIQPASQPELPDPNECGEYTWNENQVEFILTQNNDEVLAAKIEHFLNTLGVKNIGPSRVRTFVNSGLTSIAQILTASVSDFESLDRIGPKLANNMYQTLHTKIIDVPLARVMAASGIFSGIGEKRFDLILQQYPNLMDMANDDPQVITHHLQQVKGFNKLAHKIAIRLSSFADWLLAHPMITVTYPEQTSVVQPVELSQPQPRPQPQPVQTSRSQPQNTLVGKTIVFSGFRDEYLQTQIQNLGGRVTTSVSRNTTFLVMKDLSDMKGKANKAAELGIQVISKNDFIAQYINISP